jgi:hypothetical protein
MNQRLLGACAGKWQPLSSHVLYAKTYAYMYRSHYYIMAKHNRYTGHGQRTSTDVPRRSTPHTAHIAMYITVSQSGSCAGSLRSPAPVADRPALQQRRRARLNGVHTVPFSMVDDPLLRYILVQQISTNNAS